MKRIVFLISLIAFPAYLQAQIKENDLLISRQQYESLKGYQAKYQELLSLQARFDSMASANLLLAAELESIREGDRMLRNTVANLGNRNEELQQANTILNTRNNAMRATANKYRYRYEQEPRYRDKMVYAFLWAGLMTAGFYTSVQDDYQRAAIIGTGISSAATITLAIALTSKKK